METIINKLKKESIIPYSIDERSLINLEIINEILNSFKKILYPSLYYEMNKESSENYIEKEINTLYKNLEKCIDATNLDHQIKNTVESIIEHIPNLKNKLDKDIIAIYEGDPAAKNHQEIILAYASFEAIMGYRIAHLLDSHKLELIARVCSGIIHRSTGIDIHPKASIGEYFCIDHGTGIVIGETAIIGNRVKMYQGVTIGALSVQEKESNQKRHPSIENNVTIYAGATILGGNTVIGSNSIIGGNVWITKSIPNNSKIMFKGSNIEYTKKDN